MFYIILSSQAIQAIDEKAQQLRNMIHKRRSSAGTGATTTAMSSSNGHVATSTSGVGHRGHREVMRGHDEVMRGRGDEVMQRGRAEVMGRSRSRSRSRGRGGKRRGGESEESDERDTRDGSAERYQKKV